MTRDHNSPDRAARPSGLRWYRGGKPGSTGRFFGALAGIGFIAPFPLATWLERSAGDPIAIIVLALLLALSISLGVLLLSRRRPVEAGMFAPVALGCAVSIWITAAMEW